MRSDTLVFAAWSSELAALPTNVYEIDFVAPAGIVTVPLSALARASGRLNVDVSVHATRAAQRSLSLPSSRRRAGRLQREQRASP